eukprot:6496094-Alexandrium_andersonii.AAC.1
MSASLVGSEMCIRDRCPDVRKRPLPNPPAATPLTKTATPTTEQLMLGTVSYTHLTLPTICSV